jgi:Arc/MetJ family transcription regulator
MRTSIEISDSLLAEVRREMAKRRTTLRSLVEDGLRRVLEEASDQRPAMPDACFPGTTGFASGVDASDLPRLIEAEIHDRAHER